ncbi:MAG: hypothetical protein QOG76_2669, partial [Pseudonocardiales bacterium]|nr:hypothetical protein [Pseudonocardiales bacterium]
MDTEGRSGVGLGVRAGAAPRRSG